MFGGNTNVNLNQQCSKRALYPMKVRYPSTQLTIAPSITKIGRERAESRDQTKEMTTALWLDR